jgi:hypothetical protein
MNDLPQQMTNITTENTEVVLQKNKDKLPKSLGFIPRDAALALSKVIASDLKKAREIVRLDEFLLKEKDNLIELINLGFSVDDIVLKLRNGGFDGATKSKVRSLLNLK